MVAEEDRERAWRVLARFAVHAPDRSTAQRIVADLLEQMEVQEATPPILGDVERGVWIAEVELDLSGLAEIAPDDAATRMLYLVRKTGVGWHGSGGTGSREVIREWPNGWASREEVLGHPQVRAAQLIVTPR